MDEVRGRARAGIGSTALGRLLVTIERDGEQHEMILQRRCGDDVHARAWCENAIRNLAPGSDVLEVTVLIEHWRATHSWDRGARDAITESVQLGIFGGDGEIRWADPRDVSTGRPI